MAPLWGPCPLFETSTDLKRGVCGFSFGDSLSNLSGCIHSTVKVRLTEAPISIEPLSVLPMSGELLSLESSSAELSRLCALLVFRLSASLVLADMELAPRNPLS